MKVVLDTNILCADNRLSGGSFRTFWEALPRVSFECCVPSVVLDEVIAVHRRKLAEVAKRFEKEARSWSQLTGDSISTLSQDLELDRYSDQYADYLAQLFRFHNVTVLPYPDISHPTLVQRALHRRKPFSESGSGYRDSLIWATVLELQTTNAGAIVFVTNNWKDFGKSPSLHPDLAVELGEGTSIDLYNTLEQFNAAKIIPHLEHLENVLRQLQDDRHTRFSLSAWIDDEIQDVLNENDDGCHFVGLEPDHGSVWVSEIKQRGQIIVDDVRQLPSGNLLVLANVDLTLTVSVSAQCDDCDRYTDVYEFFGGDCSGSPTVWVEEKGNVAFTLTIKGDSFKVDWCDIDEIQGICSVEINPHPRREA